jgi:hypothetical protein
VSDLLETVLAAHGGLERWNQLDTVSARLIQGGVLWAVKGQAGVLDDVVVTAVASRAPFCLDRSQRDRVRLTQRHFDQLISKGGLR